MEQEERLRDWMEKYTNRLYRLAYIPSDETKTRLIDAKNNAYVTEFPALNPDQQPVFVTHEFKEPIFPKELEMTIPLQ